MNGIELGRRLVQLRGDAMARAKLELLWQGRPPGMGATAADCARNAREPLRRLEALRRRTEPVPPFPPGIAYRSRPSR